MKYLSVLVLMITPFSLMAESFFEHGRAHLLFGYGAGSYRYVNQLTIFESYMVRSVQHYQDPISPELAELRDLADVEAAMAQEWTGRSRHSFLKVEFAPQSVPALAISAGIRFASNRQSCQFPCGQIGNIYRASIPGEGPFPLILLSSLERPLVQRTEVTIRYTMLETAVAYHPLYDGRLDPYFGGSLGVGFCSYPGFDSSDSSCNIGRLALQIGLRFHLVDSYFVQAEMEWGRQEMKRHEVVVGSMKLATEDHTFFNKKDYGDAVASLAFGVRLK